MSADTPATIAILGAGPIGLEAALYARFLGYDAKLYERGRVGENLLRYAHVRLFSPFSMNCSPLGLAALEAHGDSWRPPDPDALLTAGEHVEAYLTPLSQTDLLSENIREEATVVAVSRDGPLKGDFLADTARGECPFRILWQDAAGQEHVDRVDVVIDTTGTYGNPNWLGPGGIPAAGERAMRSRIEHGLPDILGAQRDHYAGRRVLVVGAGYSAATNVIALAELAAAEPQTNVTWITRSEPGNGEGPIPLIANDRLPERDRVARSANRLAAHCDNVTHCSGTTVGRIQSVGEVFAVELFGQRAGEIEVERIIANVGFRPDASIYSELQVHECYASGGPMKLAAALLESSSADCLDQASAGPETLLNPEPDFYILGAKSYGRNSKFLIKLGLEQIRDVFILIVGRAELDLYRTVRPAQLASPG